MAWKSVRTSYSFEAMLAVSIKIHQYVFQMDFGDVWNSSWPESLFEIARWLWQQPMEFKFEFNLPAYLI